MKNVSVTMLTIFHVQLYKCPKINIIIIFALIFKSCIQEMNLKTAFLCFLFINMHFFTILAIKGRRESGEPMNFSPSLIHHISDMCPKS